MGAGLSYEDFLRETQGAGGQPAPSGDDLSYDAYQREVQQQQGTLGAQVSGAVRSFGRGAVPFYAQIAAALQSAGHAVLPGLIAPGGQQEIDRIKGASAQFAQAHPVENAAGLVTGALASPLNKLIPGGGGTLAARAAKAAASGAVLGGLYAAGDADQGQRLDAATHGAIAGGVLGAALPAAAEAIRTAYSAPLGAASRLASVVRAAGGNDALNAEAQRLASLGRGDQTMLADLHPKLGALADQVATTSDDARQVIQGATQARQGEQAGRVLQDVRAGLQGVEPSVAERQAALETSRRAWAAGPQGFGGLREANPAIPTRAAAELMDVIRQPRVRGILGQARENGLIGSTPDASMPFSFQNIQDLREGVSDAATAAFRQGKGNLGTRLAEVDATLKDWLTRNVPGWADVNAEYARRKGLEEALQSGAEAWGKSDVQGLAQQVGKLSPDQLEQFRTGMAAKMVEQLSGAKTNRDVATALSNAGRAEQSKLQVVFGDQPTFQRFMQQMAAEKQLSALKGATAGSPTARRLNAGANALATVMGSAGLYAHNPALAAGAALTYGAKLAAQRAMMRQANELAPMLTTSGPEAIQQLLEQLSASRRAPLSPALQRALTGAGGVAGGLLAP